MKKSPGRKPIGDKAFTPAQKMQRKRAKNTFYIRAAEENGYMLCPVLVCKNQLRTLASLFKLESYKNRDILGDGLPIDNRVINDVIYHAMKMYLESFIEGMTGRFPDDIVKSCDATNYPDDLNALMEIESISGELFKEWELLQANQKEI